MIISLFAGYFFGEFLITAVYAFFTLFRPQIFFGHFQMAHFPPHAILHVGQNELRIYLSICLRQAAIQQNQTNAIQLRTCSTEMKCVRPSINEYMRQRPYCQS